MNLCVSNRIFAWVGGWVPVTRQGMQPDDGLSCGWETERRLCGFSEGWGCSVDCRVAVRTATSEALLPSTLVNHPSKLSNSFRAGKQVTGRWEGASEERGRTGDKQYVCIHCFPLENEAE